MANPPSWTNASHTVASSQILAPYTPQQAALNLDAGVYTYFGSGNFDFSNSSRFPGNQYFPVTPTTTGTTAQPPTIATAAAASPSPVSGTTTNLSVLGADTTDGESALTYTWSTLGTPPASVNFSANGTNAAKASTATFTASGVYNFLVTVADGSRLWSSPDRVCATITILVLSPTSTCGAPSRISSDCSAFSDTCVEKVRLCWSVIGWPSITNEASAWSPSG